ncbi:sialate O-acetylesterase isoform X4 [Stegostoma tigrinum]|uniref:sialate O-acetylesterase isoform X4 n=1 Tax=Stegostoma tigrinum TaxID=3053191 RepID=UPI00202B3211|nr:sialate O-acetylesterase isoform X4 [Stegostoma tigrinum]
MARRKFLCLFVGVALLLDYRFCKEFGFASYYANHMVLQKEPARAVIWGYGIVGAIIHVIVQRENTAFTHKVTAVKEGGLGNISVWNVSLEPVGPGGPFLIIAEQTYFRRVDKIVLKDVYFGDIWLCGGQSNMAMTVSQIINASEELSLASRYPYIRLFQAGLRESYHELNDLDSIAVQWSIPTAGEANTVLHTAQYNCTFPAMIEDWRQIFHQGSGGATEADFPFGFVQLSTDHHAVPDDSFPWIRWHQTADFGYAPNSKMKRTFMAVAMDLGDEESPYGVIHPRDKQDIAYRLYLGARAVAYGETAVVFQGPFPKEVQLKNSRELTITYTEELTVLELRHDLFEVCCCTTWDLSNCKWLFVPIVNHSINTLSLSLSQCHQKVTGIRYAWMEWPCDLKKCPLYGKDSNLPASTFMLPSAHNGVF